MKGAVITGYGGNEVVELRELPDPLPKRDEVLVRVRGASVNPVDWKIRSGQLRLLTGFRFPKLLGMECAGTVEQTGAGVSRFARGDAVIVVPGARRLGAYAQTVCASQKYVFHSPRNLSFPEASTLPIAGLTALQSLRDLGRLRAGGQVLINGASGGVGTFAVQIARILQAQVTAVCSGRNAELVRQLGADRVIDYGQEDFTHGGPRYDLVFDAVAKSTFAESRRALAPGGIYVSTLPSFSILLNRFVTGVFTSRKARLVMVRSDAADMDWMRQRIEADSLRVVVDRSYPLEQIREAFAYSETGRARGKVVVEVG